jgi:hypothetical protein
MNDYYPFLMEKVSELEKVSESRRELYKDAREELATKLAHPTPRVPEAEIAKECRAFDAAIQTIEAVIERERISDAESVNRDDLSNILGFLNIIAGQPHRVRIRPGYTRQRNHRGDEQADTRHGGNVRH